MADRPSGGRPTTRRRFLRAGAVAAAVSAGCPRGPDETPPGTAEGTPSEGRSPPGEGTASTAQGDAATAGGDWPRRHRDAANTDRATAAEPTGPVERLWSASRGDALYGPPTPPVVAEGTVFFGGPEGSLYALDAVTGEERWSVALAPEGSLESAPTYVDGTVYVNDGGYGDNRLHAVDAASGTVLWSEPHGEDRAAPPNERDGTLFFGTFRQGFYAVDAADGREQWSRELLVRLTPMPAVDDGGVYVSYYDPIYPGGVGAFDPLTGNLLWTFREPGAGPGTATASTPGRRATELQFQPAVALGDETVYFASVTGTVFALGKSDGTARWSFDTDGPIPSSPVVGGGRVYVGSAGGRVHALDPAEGTAAWSVGIGDPGSGGAVAPVAAGDTVFAFSGRTIVALDGGTGEQLWRVDDVNVTGVPAVAHGPAVARGRFFARTYDSVVAFGAP